MTFANPLVLAQNFDQGGGGSGGGDEIVDALDNFAGWLSTIGGAVLVVALLAAIILVGMKIKNGGSLGDALGPLLLIFIAAILLGLGPIMVSWFMGLGESLG